MTLLETAEGAPAPKQRTVHVPRGCRESQLTRPAGEETVTEQEMAAARLPIAYRDTCAHLLVPLNRCRYDTFYMPWKCQVPRSLPPSPMAV